jgi:histidinol-phosphate aminotransferase
VVDEAYIDFGGVSALSLIDTYPILLVIQTFSKSRSLAGIRVGFALGHAKLIEGMERVKNSFNSYPVDQMAEASAIAAMKDTAYFEETVAKVIATREWASEQLTALGYEVLPSKTNFLFARPSRQDAEFVFKALRERNIVIRYFQQPRIDGYVRITVGTDAEMQALVDVLREIDAL